MAAEEALRRADEVEAARKRAEEELERVRKDTETDARRDEPVAHVQYAAQDLLQANPSGLIGRITKQMDELARQKTERAQLLDHHSKQMEELARHREASQQRAARMLEEKLAARKVRKKDE